MDTTSAAFPPSFPHYLGQCQKGLTTALFESTFCQQFLGQKVDLEETISTILLSVGSDPSHRKGKLQIKNMCLLVVGTLRGVGGKMGTLIEKRKPLFKKSNHFRLFKCSGWNGGNLSGPTSIFF